CGMGKFQTGRLEMERRLTHLEWQAGAARQYLLEFARTRARQRREARTRRKGRGWGGCLRAIGGGMGYFLILGAGLAISGVVVWGQAVKCKQRAVKSGE